MSTLPYEKRHDTHSASDIPTNKKRRKGATRLSCAECRRLKLRCDRAIPCSSCVKRGCSAICPDGSLTTGQGNRFVLASTQELHEKISELALRVRDLEDALRASHFQLSTDPHPLLSEELLKIKAPLQREPPASRQATQKIEEDSTEVVDAFGSLSIGLSGRAKYYGSTANSWYFLQNESQEEDNQESLVHLQGVLPTDILSKAAAFPISTLPHTIAERSSTQSLFRYLPSPEKAFELKIIYYSHAAWMYNPISTESFDKEVYAQFYDQHTGPLSDDPIICHRLSLMFIVLAIGSLMDTSLPAYNLDAEVYHQLAKAALFHHSFIDEPTVTAVQALFLMTFYLFLADRHGTSTGARWTIMGIAVKVGQSIGLHRDSGRWKVDPTETQRRRELFWELFTYDSWQCLTFGRPPSFALPHVDCKMPHGNNPTDGQTFHAWKHRFTSECMNVLHDQAFGAKMPTYATVLQLDRKMRAFPVPPLLQVTCYSPGGMPDTVMLTLQRHIVLAIREMNLLYLHRSFFARAISDHPKDPLGSPYGTSVLAAYRSAGSLVALMRNLHTQLTEPSERIWFLWTHMFSCAIVLGSIVTRCPSMSIAPSALAQLDSACELFSKAARGFRANQVLGIMLHLQQKAHHSLNEFRNGRGTVTNKYNSDPIMPEDDDDELSILGGKTRLIAKMEPSSPVPVERSPHSNNPVVPLPLSPSAGSHFDPNVWDYLNSFQQPHHTNHLLQSPQNDQVSPGSQNSFSDTDISPVSMYGMAPMAGTTYSSEAQFIGHGPPSATMVQTNSVLTRQNSNGQASSSQAQQIISPANPQSVMFPQYFSVYDYGTSIVNGNQTNAILDMNPNPGNRRSSGSPEANMHSTWQEFVTGVAIP
ncbi:hypothetical protein AMATHDRAFT_70926 [Amanita thiersii Skay4041]|uniref:Zn(2)-C6 fungal-type domain-containing protein n=1 Tax=Amanita thiersii Skay4041 TaxID=703135 RepID=A0A2A9NE45_9AGAR|nr:hypothetical protein AMATHDRAFT_70926 [Amanita thiersii Skay4041]